MVNYSELISDIEKYMMENSQEKRQQKASKNLIISNGQSVAKVK